MLGTKVTLNDVESRVTVNKHAWIVTQLLHRHTNSAHSTNPQNRKYITQVTLSTENDRAATTSNNTYRTLREVRTAGGL